MGRRKRDLTQAQFDEQCKAEGFRAEGFLGYYDLGVGGLRVSAWNAGTRRRDRIAYLRRERDKARACAAIAKTQ